MFEIGFKLRLSEVDKIEDVKRFYRENECQYFELYVQPFPDSELIKQWAESKLPIVIHAPHMSHNVNLAQRELRTSNIKVFESISDCADRLSCNCIVTHPGNDGTVEEVIEQLNCIDDKRIALENKPYRGLNGKICIGHSPEEFFKFQNAGVLNDFILDVGHAIYSAVAQKLDPFKYISMFLPFNPKMIHIADGDMSSVVDVHHKFGEGNFDIKSLVSLLPANSKLTLEIPVLSNDTTSVFVENARKLREFLI